MEETQLEASEYEDAAMIDPAQLRLTAPSTSDKKRWLALLNSDAPSDPNETYALDDNITVQSGALSFTG